MEKIKLLELFSGIQAQERALRQLGIPYESVGTCDCDKDVLVSTVAMRFNLNEEMENYNFPEQDKMIEELQARNIGYDFEKEKHTITERTPISKLKQYYLADKLSKNLGDISKVERLPYADLVTYSSPCQSFSVAGKLAGATKTCKVCGCKWNIDFDNPDFNYKCPSCSSMNLESTTSGLLQEVQRLLSVAYENNELPKYLVLENVKNLVGKKFKPQFDAWIRWLDSIGYNTYWKVINGKYMGVPQNRERVFAVSIRKDVDNNNFKFPEEIPLTIRLKDILENSVDEKYYLPNERIEKILNSSFMQEKKRIQNTDVCDTLLARDWKDPKCVKVDMPQEEPFVAASRGRNPENSSDRTVGSPTEQRLEPNFSGCTNTLTSVQKDNYVVEPQVLRAERTEYGKQIRKQYESGEIEEKIGNMREMSPRNDGISNTITTVQKDNYIVEPTAIVEDQFPGSRDARIYKDYSPTLRQNCGGLKVAQGDNTDPVRIGNIYGEQFGTGYAGNVWDKEAISPAIMTCQGGNRQPMIVVEEPQIAKCIGGIGEKKSNGGTQYFQQDRVYCGDVALAHPANIPGGSYKYMVEDNIKWRIRKLTPKECWRLMNFSDEDHDRAAQFVSSSALYKQAGNSIIVSDLIGIFSSLFVEDGYKSEIWTKYILNYFD